MVSASQDIDYFIERQRSKLNKTNNRPVANQNRRTASRQPPPPPARQPNQPTNRLDYQVARILDAPTPRSIPDPNIPLPSSRSPFLDPSQSMFPSSDDNQTRRQSISTVPDNRLAFFDSFGSYDEKRAKLNEDRQREYNEFLRSKEGAVSKNKLGSKSMTSRSNTTRRVQFQADPTVVAPWEKDNKRTPRNTQPIDDSSSATGISTEEYIRGRPRPKPIPDPDEEYIRAREEYILELYAQIRELEERKRLLELESSRLTSNTSNVIRAHYAEDLRALNTLLAERLNQRSAVDQELTRILNRPPISATPTHLGAIGLAGLSPTFDGLPDALTQRDPGGQTQRTTGGRNARNDNRSRANGGTGGFQIGREVDKDAEQAAKKRYQQELLAQMREAQMRKAQAKQEKDQYEKKLEDDIKRYNYFGRSGGGAPMRDREGNVVANLADLRAPQNGQGQGSGQSYGGLDNKGYPLGVAPSAITNAPFYNGQENQNPLNTARTGSPNHARGAVSNGIFGTIKTDEQLAREEKYKQDLKKQIDEKRQRNAEEIARRRAEEERELAKHIEWQQQMDKQMADETMRKQEREVQERQQQEEMERQRQYEDSMSRRKPKRVDKPRTPPNDDQNGDRQNTMDDQTNPEPAFRSSSPPIPAIKNRGKKKKTTDTRVKRTPPEDSPRQQPRSPINFDIPTDTRSRGNEIEDENDNDIEHNDENPIDHDENQNEKPASPPIKPIVEKKKEPLPPKKKIPSSYRVVQNPRTASMTSLRSDGSDSETLNRLDLLKRQLKEKEHHFYQQARRQRAEAALPDIDEYSTSNYIPPSKPLSGFRESPEYLLNTTRLPRRTSPNSNDRLLRILQNDDDEYRPSYFRDDSILMRGTDGYVSPAKRVDLVDGIFVTNIEDTARRRRYDLDTWKYYDRDNPTSMASLQLDRIAEQNEMRLKKLRDLERDDISTLDSNEVLERFQRKQRLQTRGSLTTLQDDAWLH